MNGMMFARLIALTMTAAREIKRDIRTDWTSNKISMAIYPSIGLEENGRWHYSVADGVAW
jgi:hypothetical protein